MTDWVKMRRLAAEGNPDARARLEKDRARRALAHAAARTGGGPNQADAVRAEKLRAARARAYAKAHGSLPGTPLDRTVSRVSLLAALRAPQYVDQLAARLGLTRAELGALLSEAQWEGVPIHQANGLVSLIPAAASDEVTEILPLAGEGALVRVGVISDTHFGSKYTMRRELADCVGWMADQGIRLVLHAGDWTQGIYSKHSAHEVTATSQADQLKEMAEWLPRHAGLRYVGIAGNHDETWVSLTGFPFASAQAQAWREAGRDDVQIVGSIGAFVDVGGVVIHLWHGGSITYALSYHLQRKAESYAAVKPSVLIAGHVHRYCHVEQRGIECVLAPCFQGGSGPFSQQLKGSPAIGGLILSWRMTTGGSFREFRIDRRRYYERERIHSAGNPLHGETVEPAVASVRVVP